jgi:hypothetical protein
MGLVWLALLLLKHGEMVDVVAAMLPPPLGDDSCGYPTSIPILMVVSVVAVTAVPVVAAVVVVGAVVFPDELNQKNCYCWFVAWR